jgi:hypothetical protein
MIVEAHRWDGTDETRDKMKDWVAIKWMIVKEGDWILRDLNGKIRTMTDTEFHQNFEPTDSESAEAMGLENDVQKKWG